MNISELFNKLQEELSNDLKGELTLKAKSIIWTFDLNKNSEEIDAPNDDDDEEFNFEAQSPEELLIEAYIDDLENIQQLLDEYDESENYLLSDPETNETTISFRITENL
jgi:hypothetical protein